MNKHFDLVLFVNDMFLKPGESFLKDYADIALLKKSLDENKIIGRIDSTGQHYTAYNYDVSQWVCTNCFIAPMAAVHRLKDIISVKVRNILNESLLTARFAEIGCKAEQYAESF